MGSLSKFLGKPKEIEINGEKLTIHPLKVKDMSLFKQDASEEEMKEIGKKILKLSIQDTTEEEIDELDMNTYMQIMDEVNKLNGFKDERLDTIKAKLAKARKE